MSARVFPLALVNVPNWLARTGFAVIVLCDQASQTPPASFILDGLAAVSGERGIAAGRLLRSTPAEESTWRQVWRTKLGPFSKVVPPPPGAYLFFDGAIVGHAPLPTGGVPLDVAWSHIRDIFRERIELEQVEVGDDQSWTSPSSTSRTMPSAPPPEEASTSPYGILGVTASATNDEVKKAYREAVKLNHPDRVRHMSEPIQKFAEQRTRVIMDAWDIISRHRGMR